MDERPIGVFDSGLGGLTAVREIRSILPFENIIYFGDTSRVPYGGRSREILLKYARQDVHFLRSFDIKALLVACGTVSSNVLPELQRESELPILGVVEPACRRALAVTRSKRVGLIATAASVRSGAYERTLAAMDGEVTVIAKACPLFVPPFYFLPFRFLSLKVSIASSRGSMPEPSRLACSSRITRM